jgi:hypothetical protein
MSAKTKTETLSLSVSNTFKDLIRKHASKPKALTSLEFKEFTCGEYLVGEKLDGSRMYLCFQTMTSGDGQTEEIHVFVTDRTLMILKQGLDMSFVPPAFLALLRNLSSPACLVLDGEYLQKEDSLYVFDFFYQGISSNAVQRQQWLMSVLYSAQRGAAGHPSHTKLHISNFSTIVHKPYTLGKDLSSFLFVHHAWNKGKQKEEGWIFTSISRPDQVFKLKNHHTVDLFVHLQPLHTDPKPDNTPSSSFRYELELTPGNLFNVDVGEFKLIAVEGLEQLLSLEQIKSDNLEQTKSDSRLLIEFEVSLGPEKLRPESFFHQQREFQLIAQRIRTDKTHANTLQTIQHTLHAQLKPITIQDIAKQLNAENKKTTEAKHN